MSTQPLRMVDDLSEPSYVRELLQAGATDSVNDYDYEKGLVKHLGLITGGALPPSWAESTGAAAKAGATSSMKMAALWLGVPIASAGVVAAVLLTGNELPRTTSVKQDVAPTEYIATGTNAENQIEPAVVQEKTTDGVNVQTPQQLNANIERPRRMPAQSYYARHRTSMAHVVAARSTGNTKNRADVGKSSRTNAQHSEVTPNPYLYKVTQARTDLAKGEKQPAYDEARNAASASRRKAVPQELKTDAPRAVEAVEMKVDKAETAKVSIAIQPFVEVEQKGSEQKEYNPSEKEISMVAMANRYLQSDPQRALDLALLGEREFPKGTGMLAQERRYIRVLSLIKLGRADEARSLGMKYLSRYPKGPFSDRIRRALATGEVPEE